MAYEKQHFTIGLVNGGIEGEFLLSGVLKKFFPPVLYTIKTPTVHHKISDAKRALIDSGEVEGFYAREARNPWALVEAHAVSGFDVDDSLNIVLALSHGTHSSMREMGQRIQSHAEMWAMLIERTPRERAAGYSYRTYVSMILEPYTGTCGMGPGQVDRMSKTVMKRLIEGWKFSSKR